MRRVWSDVEWSDVDWVDGEGDCWVRGFGGRKEIRENAGVVVG